MSASTDPTSGMLDTYLRERHAVLEETACRKDNGNENQPTDNPAAANNHRDAAANAEIPDQAVEDLDEDMAAMTDKKIMKQGLEHQKSKLLPSPNKPEKKLTWVKRWVLGATKHDSPAICLEIDVASVTDRRRDLGRSWEAYQTICLIVTLGGLVFTQKQMRCGRRPLS